LPPSVHSVPDVGGDEAAAVDAPEGADREGMDLSLELREVDFVQLLQWRVFCDFPGLLYVQRATVFLGHWDINDGQLCPQSCWATSGSVLWLLYCNEIGSLVASKALNSVSVGQLVDRYSRRYGGWEDTLVSRFRLLVATDCVPSSRQADLM